MKSYFLILMPCIKTLNPKNNPSESRCSPALRDRATMPTPFEASEKILRFLVNLECTASNRSSLSRRSGGTAWDVKVGLVF